MIMPLKKFVVFLLLAAVGSSIHSLALAADQPSARPSKPALKANKTNAIEIAQIDPSPGDVKRIEQKRKKAGATANGAEDQVHVVKIYVDLPTPGAAAPVFYIGDEKIEEYGSFNEGIFVKVYSVKQLQSWQGKPLRVQHRGEMIDLKANVPAKPDRTPARLPKLDEALTNSASPN